MGPGQKSEPQITFARIGSLCYSNGLGRCYLFRSCRRHFQFVPYVHTIDKTERTMDCIGFLHLVTAHQTVQKRPPLVQKCPYQPIFTTKINSPNNIKDCIVHLPPNIQDNHFIMMEYFQMCQMSSEMHLKHISPN